MDFTFATSGQIVFGAGRRRDLVDVAKPLGSRALLVTGTWRAPIEEIVNALEEAELVGDTFQINVEPCIDDIESGLHIAREKDCDFVIAIGGGSVIDTGKAIAALLTNPSPPLAYLEVVGDGQPLDEPAAPLVALPTTAGTGAEVTRNAVLYVPDKHVKVSLRHPSMLPRIALVDPELTYSVPREVTIATGLDALTQCIEPYVSVLANPLTDPIAWTGIELAARNLSRVVNDPQDVKARANMCLASLCGGLALANAKLGAVHGFAGVIGGLAGAPHGSICAALLPHVFSTNVNALRERDPESHILPRYTTVARLLTGDAAATIEDGVKWLNELTTEFASPSLKKFGIGSADFPTIIEKSKSSSSMKGNSISLTDEELQAILGDATT